MCLSTCRKVAKSLQKSTNYTNIEELGLHKPILDIPTRWNSSFDIVERLLELKNICNSQNGDLHNFMNPS